MTDDAREQQALGEQEGEPRDSVRCRAGVERVYANDRIVVEWEPRLCIHTGNCLRGMPEVFDATARPWVRVEAGEPDEIASTVLTCPTGALHYRRLDGGPEEEGSEETEITPRPNWPLFLRGRIRIQGVSGRVIREDTRVALCRCGASGNKPFCDGSHRRIEFRTASEAPET
jgi:uncharacterized Fe-S cluster protein YjdI/CDGSH-type Zn-finger protein